MKMEDKQWNSLSYQICINISYKLAHGIRTDMHKLYLSVYPRSTINFCIIDNTDLLENIFMSTIQLGN